LSCPVPPKQAFRTPRKKDVESESRGRYNEESRGRYNEEEHPSFQHRIARSISPVREHVKERIDEFVDIVRSAMTDGTDANIRSSMQFKPPPIESLSVPANPNVKTLCRMTNVSIPPPSPQQILPPPRTIAINYNSTSNEQISIQAFGCGLVSKPISTCSSFETGPKRYNRLNASHRPGYETGNSFGCPTPIAVKDHDKKVQRKKNIKSLPVQGIKQNYNDVPYDDVTFEDYDDYHPTTRNKRNFLHNLFMCGSCVDKDDHDTDFVCQQKAINPYFTGEAQLNY